MNKLNITGNNEEMSHMGVDAILDDTNHKAATYQTFQLMLEKLKPYIDKGICKVRFITFDQLSKIGEISMDESKHGYSVFKAYALMKKPHLRKGLFVNTAVLAVLKKNEDIKEGELLGGLKNDK